MNPYSESFFKIKILGDRKHYGIEKLDTEDQVAKKIIAANLKEAIRRRDLFAGYEDGCRLVYGINDSLPGIIVDKYKKYILAQINTAGMDRFRPLVLDVLQVAFPQHQILFFDNKEYRKAEVLPDYESEKLEEDLLVVENGLSYSIPKEVVQKIGYYYDHRENRKKIFDLLLRSKLPKKNGLDLFSYVGSWGLHLLKANVEKVDFVDQANMEAVTIGNLKLNGFGERGSFTRADVFKFLDEAISLEKRYDVIISDPPAFTKSEKNKNMAIQGYEKLHLKAMKLLSDEGLMVVASCTHYVNYEELDKTVQDAAFKNKQRVQLLDLGGQGFDHLYSGFKDKSFYIKYLVYYVSRG